ncbi:putative nuclease HARBI1 [Symphorus nematophorus]
MTIYRFSSKGKRYLCQLLEPYISSATCRSNALTVPQTVCISLWYFATGTFMYAVGDAEQLSKNTFCHAATCDHQCLITTIEAKWPGSLHDSCIFRESALCHRFELGLFSGVLVDDKVYACRHFLMTPYPDPGPGPQTTFNVAISRTRIRKEMMFGVLKARFICLHALRVSPGQACRIISACAALHNITTIRKERVPPAFPKPHDVVHPGFPTGKAAGYPFHVQQIQVLLHPRVS